MGDLLKQAQALLSISEVHTREVVLKVDENENFMSLSKIKKTTQSYRSMVKIEEIELSKDDGSNKRFYYIFTYAVGIRLVREDDRNNDKADSLFMIEAEFDACYLSQKEVTKEQLNAFSQNNVGYHIWPYWRELVQSSCSKSGMAVIRIPYYQLSKEETEFVLKEEDSQ
ncbi:hypothetical protein [Yersinia frederiksenii]|uniref:hypothetical protein n=1 Tax=Yersinia frederiksenii TaxID=29484 RepID=UPI0005E713D4|nr:hypothetical protein [Yersinia frederiksenii]CQJ02373.1 Uncharacterised protein [Yersinia frederiksenii]